MFTVTVIVAIFIFLFGLCVGSFLNVVIYRLPKKESVVKPPSHCPKCTHQLVWWENIPLLSYLILRGKCRKCKEKISLQYPLVEFTTSLLFLFVWLKFDFSWTALAALFFVTILIVVAVIDIHEQIIPNRIIVPAILAGLVLFVLSGLLNAKFVPLIKAETLYVWLQPLVGFLVGGGFLLAVALVKEEGMGGGDIKLAAFMGLFLGWYVVLAMFIGFLTGAIVGLSLILLKKKGRKEPISFGPFLALGSLATLFWGPQIFRLYVSLWL